MITFTKGGYSITVTPPDFGYSTEISMQLVFTERENGTVGVFDAGTTYDKRVCKCRFLFDYTDALEFVEFFTNRKKGRGNQVTLGLGVTASGFFPFGPDMGDKTNFTVQLLDFTPPSQLLDPLRYWAVDATFLRIDGPSVSYTYSPVSDHGNIQIGTVQNLRYPEDTFKVDNTVAATFVPVKLAEVETVDLGNSADSYRVNFTLTARQTVMADFITFLTTVPRDSINKTYNPFNVITSSNQFIYGIDKGGDGTYSSQLLQKSISVRHARYDEFMTSLNFRMVA